MIIPILLIAVGVVFCVGLYQIMEDGERYNQSAHRARIYWLQCDLNRATANSIEVDRRRREAMSYHRVVDSQRWMIHLGEAKQLNYIKSFRIMWNGDIG